MDHAALEAFADELFERWREGDFDFVEASFAPDAELRIPALGRAGTFASLRPHLEENAKRVGPHTHEAVRRTIAEPDLVVEEHVSRWKDVQGRDQAAEVCGVVRIGADGLVADMVEYVRFVAGGDPRQKIIDTVRAHVVAEFTNDVDVIMPTVSEKDVFFPIVSRGADGIYAVDMIVDTPGATSYYRETREVYTVLSSTHMMALSSDWFVVRASIGKLELHEAAAPGAEGVVIENPSVVIFPVADDGIIGEIIWAKNDFLETIAAAKAGTPLPIETDALRQMANSNRIRDFLEAWQAGDVAAIDGMVADQPCWVTKVVTAELATTELRSITDRAEVLDHYRTSPAPADVIVLTQMVTDWFAIVETRFRPGADGTTRRKIATYPFADDGRIIGELSYSIDVPG